ncbi:MAG: pyrimidine 5'-nucleotidase [Rhizobiales bacterium]|nr:pyrimidine 5'-nucleotidase [Hyphomicrobiales bacterium]
MSQSAAEDLSHVENWIFDLDNTLYPPVCNLFSQVDQRMTAFITALLDVDEVEARRLQKTYYVDHGTTLSGLMAVHGMDPAEFLDYVHDIDVSALPPDDALGQAIAALPGRKVIFTNGTVAHAENVAGQLGIAHVFDGIYDIVSTGYEPKPRHVAYERFLAASGIAPRRAAMFEDMARNLAVPHEMGMRTIWVRPPFPSVDETARHLLIAHEGSDGDHIHHVTEDLTGFLKAVQLAMSAATK